MVKKLLPILFLIISILIFFYPALAEGTFISTGLQFSDLMPFNYPLKHWYKEMITSGNFPFWTNLIGSGYPLFAEGQVGVLYPFHLLLFSFLPTLTAFNLNIILHFLISGVFTFIFCRISLKRSIEASLLAALAYSLSGFMMTHLHQVNIILVVSYLPLLLFLTDRLVTTKKYYFGFLLSLALALQILAGFLQLFYYTTLIVVFYFILINYLFPEKKEQKTSFKSALVFFIAILIGIGMTTVQLLPTWELTKYSQRSSGLTFEASTSTDWPLDSLLMFINPRMVDIYLPTPDFHPLNPNSVNYNVVYGYIGVIPLVLAFLGILFNLKNRHTVIFTVLLLGAIIFGLGSQTQLFTIFWSIIPGMKFFREPVKILFLIEFCLAVLAGFGLDFVRSRLSNLRNLGYLKRGIGTIILFIVFLDLYFNNGARINQVVNAKEWFEKPPAASFLEDELNKENFKIYSCGTGNLDYAQAKNTAVQADLKNILIANFNLLFQIPSSQEWVGLFYQPLVDLNEQGFGIETKKGEIMVSLQTKKSLSMQNVKYVICNLPITDSDFLLKKEIKMSKPVNYLIFMNNQKAVIPTQKIYLYEYRRFLPRAYFVSKARMMTDKKQILAEIMKEDFKPEEEVVIERSGGEKMVLNNQQLTINNSRVTLKEDKENEVDIQVENIEDGYLVLHDIYYPGWKVFDNGIESKIMRANYAFRAVELAPGLHQMKFTYEPTYWKIGIMVSGLALTLTLIGLGLIKDQP